MIDEKRGLLVPLRRDRKRDFAAGAGDDLRLSKVRQVLGTESSTQHSAGELPWRTSFGASLHLLRHQNNGLVLGELGRIYVRDALRRWLPDVQLVAVTVELVDNRLQLRVRIDGTSGTTVVVPLEAPPAPEAGT